MLNNNDTKSFSNSSSLPVQVFIRIKPSQEKSLILLCRDEKSLEIQSPRNCQESIKYQFDKVFNENENQNIVWNSCINSVKEALNGRQHLPFLAGDPTNIWTSLEIFNPLKYLLYHYLRPLITNTGQEKTLPF